jgi:hypothetical protein
MTSIRRRSHDGITFAEFDSNSNFIPDDILPDFVTRSKNHENYGLCQMNFTCDRIVDSLIGIIKNILYKVLFISRCNSSS